MMRGITLYFSTSFWLDANICFTISIVICFSEFSNLHFEFMMQSYKYYFELKKLYCHARTLQ